MATGMRIKNLQAVQRALEREVKKLRTPYYALVGIHESAKKPKGASMTMATLGAVQHFGNDKIPARPWLDKGVESGTKEILKTIREGIADGRDARQVVAMAGNEAEGAVREYIDALKTPPNAPSTVRRKKGQNNPLVDSGAMKQAVTHIVVRKKPEEGL